MRCSSGRFVVFASALALALAGCGGGDGASDRAAAAGDSAAGAMVFADADCGDCHTLSAAKSTGTKGPNLDDVRPGFARVVRQVENGGAGMPSFDLRLSDDEVRDLAAFVSGSTGGGSGTGSKPVAGDFKPDDTKLADCDEGESACYEQAFGNLTYRAGPKQALGVFDQRIAERGPIEGNCHRIAHTMGAAGLLHFKGSIGKAFAAGSASCWSGYYHGVLERAFVDVNDDEVQGEARKMCADKDLRSGPSFTLYQCVHGLGHGLMIYTGYDMPRSLKVCDGLEGSWDQTSCTGGVFMENISSSYGVTSKWLKDDDLIYPCNWVAERHKVYCYLMVTSRILAANGYDWEKTAAMCHKAELDWVVTCFQSFGRDASGNTRQNPPEILKLCAIAGTMERECIFGASRDMSSNYAGGREASVLCKRAPVKHRSYCFYGIGTILGGLEPTSEGRRKACAEITTRYRADCIDGSGG